MNRNTNIIINFYLNQGFLLFLFQNRMLEMTVRFISGEPFSALFIVEKGVAFVCNRALRAIEWVDSSGL